MFRIILTILILFSYAFADEELIQAGIKYNEASARIEAFKGLNKHIERKYYREYLKDPYRKENLQAIKEDKVKIDNRNLCPFYIQKTFLGYAVTYDDELDKTYYYNIFGYLLKFDTYEESENYLKVISYSRLGNMISVTFSPSQNEQFIYDNNGKLIAHWFDDKIIDKQNKLFQITRGYNK